MFLKITSKCNCTYQMMQHHIILQTNVFPKYEIIDKIRRQLHFLFLDLNKHMLERYQSAAHLEN